ncbi:pentatricopeptide repeat-containing protein At4g26680, mitochondrial [Phoenix dactylifera]|uniref:Pentatricopeptide repeat-containing protein At4g26680, mitochondrial n=1 Tax=Phoenix dactylifera TaxID=42345 RepID=A0A8B7CJI7_PHODC|nr:pentatricopeptide repeat-containing protein At4g26680, mitochondrial [Phoenix dactylifera]XP_008800605.2 pentatricopeptide repeat-containing protein At4g26680, mitochondrial [Phoenix dactylifera]XP_008800608.2 pentatricopeptide repeat-containing protein At4g26680, mitochondrial [Phoenix dactylifera]XP_038983345.1 pentatricopeptide repeat-containing protein At4g26680, mitochondrial [Phoenix dactylifera]XP_038983346.1 pentatricopeptide repeat-containing protein At4g26680, mitochondrial [Phoeni
MKYLTFRRFSTSFDHANRNRSSNPAMNPSFLSIPHRTIPEPRGQDHDFVAVAHSHLVHGEWPKIAALATGLTPFRNNHILLRIQRDPVLSLEFYDWAALHHPSSQNLDTHSIILHILTKAKRFKSAESILRKFLIPRTQNSSEELFDAILYSYRLCDSTPGVFDSIFKAYAHLKKFRNATDTFCRMRDYGFLPKIRSCNAFMSSLLDLGRCDIVLAFYRDMRRCRMSPNVYTLNMVMCALGNSGKLEKALELFGKMETLGFTPTVSSFNTLIAAHCKNGLMGASVKLKNGMGKKGLEPNVVTYNTLIHGFCKEGNLQEANKVFNEMKAANVSPNTVTYNSLINGYSQINNSEMGMRLYEEMLKSRVEVDIITYNALILGLCNEGKTKKAAYLVKELDKENLVPNASTFFALISGQCKRQNSERAFQIYKAMKKSGCHPNYDTFKLLISTFCKNKDFEGAIEVLMEMLERWMAPEKDLLAELLEGLRVSGKSHLATRLLLGTAEGRLIPKAYFDGLLSSSQFEAGS